MINFFKYRLIYLLISLLVISTGVFSIIKWGYQYSIDFIGGSYTEYQTSINITNQNKLKEIITKHLIGLNSMTINDKNIIIKSKPVDEKLQNSLKNSIEKEFNTKITVLKFETVGPTLGKETINKTLIASILAIIGILIYMSLSFKGFNFALSAIIAMIHDFLVVVGSYSLLSKFFGAEVDTMFVTAVLTTMSFSVHDTIVIFDKIREYKDTGVSTDIVLSSNRALTETMVRSINNSMTIVFMLLSLILFGGNTIRFFIITLLIGTITGTYSSPFVATPILVWLEKLKKK